MRLATDLYKTAAAAPSRAPRYRLFVEWQSASTAWNEANLNWIEESANVESFTITMMLDAPGENLLPASGRADAKVILRNAAWRYSAHAVGGDSAIRSFLAGPARFRGKRLRIQIGFLDAPGEWLNVFSGRIVDWRESTTDKTVTLIARDRSEELEQVRFSSPLSENIYTSDWITYIARTYGGFQGTIPTPDLQIEQSLLPIPYAWLEDDSLWEDMVAAAESEAGRVYCDPDGVLRFENALHWLSTSHTTSRHTFTVHDVEDLQPTPLLDALATKLTLEWSERQPGPAEPLYTLDVVKMVRPGETLTWQARLQRPARLLYPPAPEIDYWLSNAGGLPMNPFVTLRLDTPTPAQTVTLNLTNTHPDQAAIVRFLQIRGQPIDGGPNHQETHTITSPALSYERVRSVRASIYVQSKTHVDFLLALLEQRSRQTPMLYVLRNVAALPHLEVGDKVSFSDTRIIGATRTGYILGWELSFSLDGGLLQSFTILDSANWFPPGNYFIIGASTLDAAVCAF